MNVMVIAGDASQRVAVAGYLSGRRHRVTLSSSIPEARQILGFIAARTEAPDAVVIDTEFLDNGGEELHDHVARHFPATLWVPLPPDLSVEWLGEWLAGLAARREQLPTEQEDSRLNILVIEANRVMKGFTVSRLAARGDRIRACSSIAAARAALAGMCRRGHPPDVIVSAVAQDDGSALSFFLEARRRCPNLRWVVSCRPDGVRPPTGIWQTIRLS